MPVFRLAAASLWNRKVSALLTLLAIAFSVALFVGVDKARMGARASFENTISGTDLLVGARSGPINLLLYAVFRLGDPTANITWRTYEEIAALPQVAWTVPISLGDSHQGFRVTGTTSAFFEHYAYGRDRRLDMAEGVWSADVFDAVLGAAVARELGYTLGQEIVLAHGIGRTGFLEHDDRPFRVVGILAPTGTPVDRSLFVTLEGIEAIHVGWESGAPSSAARFFTPDQVRAMDLAPKQITAFMMGLNSRIDTLRIQRVINTYRAEPLLAIIPGVALAQLWSVVGAVETALRSVSAFVIFVGLLTILTSILTSLNERRREMAILRALGARPWHVFALLVSEAALIAGAGSLVGLAFVYGGMALAAPWIASEYGLMLAGLGPTLYDAGLVGLVVIAAAVFAVGPALAASRRALSDGLTVRL